MLIKSADDKSKRLALQEDLQKSAPLDARQTKWLREERLCRFVPLQALSESESSCALR